MKRLCLALLAVLLMVSAAAATCTTGAMPFQLQNNTLADATQVMANFNQIQSSVAANCAGNGNNNDINALSALTTPISPAQGGTTVFLGGTASGSNTISIPSVTPNAWTLTAGYKVNFIATANNTGATTLNVAGSGALNFLRKTQLGLVAMVGGELLNGFQYTATYNGTSYVLDGEMIIVGEMRTFGGSTAPPGWTIADGSTFVCTSFPALCSVISNTYGGTGANPNLPDTRARALVGLDNYGTSTGAASRLTSAATGCGSAFTALGATCANASQSHTQILAEIATHNHTVTDPGHTHNASAGSNFIIQSGSAANISGGGGAYGVGTVASATTGVTVGNNGSSQAMPIVPNVLGVLQIIKL
jgi:microcystin-dependent protein